MIPYQAFMKNAALRKNVFRPNGENDHEHCVMCGAKFSLREGDLHAGFTTLDGAYWVCPECLNVYRDEYCWTVQD